MGFTTGGIAAEIARFDRLASGAGAACENAVKAGGKVLAEALRDAAPEDTGALKKSIKASKVAFSTADGHYSEVGPGKAKHPKTGESLAKIGNILEYGRSNMKPRPWFNPAVKRAEPAVLAAMQAEIKKAEGAV